MTAPTSPARTGVWIGIATITMSFTAYTSALVVRQGSGADWQHFRLPAILYLNTVLLLASSGALELGRSLGLDLPLARATKEQYDRMVAEGLGEIDKSGIAELTFKDRYKHSADRV